MKKVKTPVRRGRRRATQLVVRKIVQAIMDIGPWEAAAVRAAVNGK